MKCEWCVSDGERSPGPAGYVILLGCLDPVKVFEYRICYWHMDQVRERGIFALGSDTFADYMIFPVMDTRWLQPAWPVTSWGNSPEG